MSQGFTCLSWPFLCINLRPLIDSDIARRCDLDLDLPLLLADILSRTDCGRGRPLSADIQNIYSFYYFTCLNKQ